MTELSEPLDAGGDASSNGRFVAVVVAVLLVVAAAAATVVVVGASGRGGARPAPAPAAAAPLDLSTVPAELAAHYRYADAHLVDYEQIPCWCGCEQFLDHRSLADCFVRADGTGWEAHAAGCAVCIGEAAIAERLLDGGHPPADVKAAVDAEYGSTAITTPPVNT